MRARTSTSVNIDVAKAERIREAEGLNQKQLGIKLGHEGSYWSGVKTTGRMKRCDVLLFKSIFGVDIEMKESEPDKGEISALPTVDIDYDKLASVFTKVIDYDKLSEAMYRAMVRALNGESEPYDEPDPE